MAGSLRDRLIGAWELVDVVEVPEDGSPPRHPFGERPIGFILYTPDGYMSAQIMRRRRPTVCGEWTDLTAEECGQQAKGYLAYSGPYAVDEETGALTHTMAVSLFPGWLGQTQPRVVRLEGESLELSTAAPVWSGGVLVTTHISWRRAASSGSAAVEA
jgi:hypothetical protein